jgi:2-dehydropantoate 2-reductase
MIDILIVGIGGIGGFFGGKLSKYSENEDDVNIHFMARGITKDTIRQSGIQVKSDQENFNSVPSSVNDKVDKLGVMDYIILCTKSYDLESTIHSLLSCIGHRTVIVPLLNGVDSRQRINRIFPNNLVTDGCANIIARRTAPGQVEVYSLFKTLHFGSQGVSDERLDNLQELFIKADIDATLTDNIWKAIWIKFIFISSAATVTSYFDKSFGEIRNHTDLWNYYGLLLDEIHALAQAKGIALPHDVKEKAMDMFRSAPADATTSMHTDFRSNTGKTELESLCGYVVREANAHGIPTTTYSKMYKYLSRPDLVMAYKAATDKRV